MPNVNLVNLTSLRIIILFLIMGHKDLLVTKVEVFTVSYGPSFFSHKSEQNK